MRKLMISGALVLAFAVGLFAGFATTPADAASCFYMCGCNGVPMKCCVTPYGLACKPDPSAPIGCPQIADC